MGVAWSIGVRRALDEILRFAAVLRGGERGAVDDAAGKAIAAANVVRDQMQAATGYDPTHIYMHPDDARGIAVLGGLMVRTSPELPRGKVVFAYEDEVRP